MTDSDTYTIQSMIPEVVCTSNYIQKFKMETIERFLDIVNELSQLDYKLEIIEPPVSSGICISVLQKKFEGEGEWERVEMPTDPGDMTQNSISLYAKKTKGWANARLLAEIMCKRDFTPGNRWWEWYAF